MSGSAKITSTDAIRTFKVGMQEYDLQVRDVVAQLRLELRRALDWIEQDRARYWPREVRRASDAVLEARHDLARCEMSLRPEDKRSCYEQKNALEQAKRRLRFAEDKVRAVRRWRIAIARQADEFEGRLGRLGNYLDADLPRAIAALERMASALDRYTEQDREGETR